MLEFEWDTEKARTNDQKHGVTFFEATEVFGDEHASSVRDPDHSLAEDRYLIFGVSSGGRHLVVAYTERDDRIRLISARQMTPRERRAYER
jgi:uncharacterized protein